jgi:hypothetical protein
MLANGPVHLIELAVIRQAPRDPQFDPGPRMPSDEIVDQDPFRRLTGVSQTQ